MINGKSKSRVKARGFIAVPDASQPLPEDVQPPLAWMVNRLQVDEENQPLMEGIFSNYNDDIVLEADTNTLVGRYDPARGPAQALVIGDGLRIENGVLIGEGGGEKGDPGPVGPQGPVGPEGPAGASSSMWLYRFDSSTQAQDPGAGRIRFNNSDPNLATRIYFDRLTQDGLDPTIAFTTAKFDDQFVIQRRGMSAQNMTWKLMAPAIDRTDWFEVWVEYVGQMGADFSNNMEITVILRTRGEPGPVGPQGAVGPQGPKGDIGYTGPQGIQGNQGPLGPQGLKGNTGDTGPQGLVGPVGPQGVQGIQGNVGSTGAKGDTGDQGVIGPRGDTGATGAQGPQGEKGDPGSLGADDVPMDSKYYARRNQSWTEFAITNAVAKTGDTMSGALKVNSWVGTSEGLYLYANGVVDQADANCRWGIQFGASDAFDIHRFDNTGVALGSALSIAGATGNTTLTGDLKITKPTYPVIFLNNTHATDVGNWIQGQQSGKYRWNIALGNADAETGANVGSNFAIMRGADDGTPIDTPLFISRADGGVTFGGAAARLRIERPAAGGDVAIVGRAGAGSAKNRWVMYMPNGDAESTGNAGSNFSISRWSDAGAVIDFPFVINRATGQIGTSSLTSGYLVSTIQLTAGGPNGALAFRITETGSGWNKYFRTTNTGTLEVINHANTAILMGLTDGGVLSCNSFNTNGIAATSVSLGSAVASTPTDLTRHLALYGNSYGASVTGNTLNLVRAGVRAAWFDGNASFEGHCYSAAGRLWGTGDGTPLWLAGGQTTGRVTHANSTGWIADAAGSQGSLEIQGPNGQGAKIAFHHVGNYAYYFGLRHSDNQLCVGGWSMGAVSYRIWHEGNINPMPVGGGTFTGAIHSNSTISSSGNLWAYGGVLYLSSAGHYMQWSADVYYFPHGRLNNAGYWLAREGTDVTFSECRSSSNMHSSGGHYYFGPAWMRWRGDLGRIDFSHNLELGTPSVSNYVWSNGGYACKGGVNTGTYTFNINWGGGDGGGAMYIGDVYVGNVLACDHRIKKDIEPLHSVWDKVKALRPIKYKVKEFTPDCMKEAAENEGKPFWAADDREHWGFAAHEMQEILTASAATGKKDDPKVLQAPNMLAIAAALAKALQEAMERIEQLEERMSHA